MEFIFNLIVVLHFVGLASLLGGFIVQMKSPDKGVNPAMLHGALTQLVTGVLMVGIVESGALDEEEPLNMSKIGTKLIVVLIITALAWVGRKKPAPQVGLWGAIGALTLLNVVLAVFW
ncbi:MAG: hypothetical protein PHN51_06420 [Candidatus Nanopelagicales bacterium]|nr:hypothetical protein [Candidatus Nanopelagicales bacterium]